jgi:signal transduction histidine kinase
MVDDSAQRRRVGRWGSRALLLAAGLALGRRLWPGARLAAGLAGLLLGLVSPSPARPVPATEERTELSELLALLSRPVERLNGVDALIAHVLGWARQALDVAWAAVVLRSDDGPARVVGLGAYPDGLEGLALEWPSPALRADGLRLVPLVAAGCAIGLLALPEPAGSNGASPGASADRRERLIEDAAPLIAAALRGCALACRTERLSRKLCERERELAALSERVVRAQEEVRRRISLDLHDEPLQRAILLQRMIKDVPDHPRAAEWVAEVEAIAASIRAICNGLRPRVLDDFGLVAGLEWLVEDLRSRSELSAWLTTAPSDQPPADEVTADGLASGRLPAELELALFRIAQEALNNCLKHARATEVHISLRREGDRVRLTIADDGEGPPAAPTGGGQVHLGLSGMRERLRPWDGVVAASVGSNGGMIITAEVNAGDGVGRGE